MLPFIRQKHLTQQVLGLCTYESHHITKLIRVPCAGTSLTPLTDFCAFIFTFLIFYLLCIALG